MRELFRRLFGKHWWVVGYPGAYGPMRFWPAYRLADPPLRSGYIWSRTKPIINYLEEGEQPPSPVMEWTHEELQRWLDEHPKEVS